MAGGGDSTLSDMIVSMPVRIYHGQGDQAAPVSGSVAMAKALHKRIGNSYANTFYYEAPPGIYGTDEHANGWFAAWNDTTFWPWMFAQSRVPDTTPPSVPTGLAAVAQAGGDRVSLSWQASTNPQSKTISYYVYRGAAKIAAVNTTSFVDSGLAASTAYQYQVAAFNLCDKVSAKSAAVSAQTPADTRQPVIEWARTFSQTSVTAFFSEKVTAATAQTAANYTIDKGISVTAAALQTDQQTVRLTVSGMTAGLTYTLTVSNITDASPAANAIAPNSAASAICRTMGYVLEEEWDNISGYRVVDLTGSAAFNGAPTRIDTMRLLDNKMRSVNNYGARVRGYLYPPASGAYTFWITSDNTSEFWLSATADPAQKKRIACLETVNMPRYEYDVVNQGKSAPVQLAKDTKYYFEILFKSAWANLFTVAWQLSDGAPRRTVPAEALIPYPDPTVVGVGKGGGSPHSSAVNQNPGFISGRNAVVSIQSGGHHRLDIHDAGGALIASYQGNGPKVYRMEEIGVPAGLFTVRAVVDGRTMSRQMLRIK
jgi:hypothetical protein